MIRKARIADVVEIQKMLRDFADTGSLLARSLSELYTTLRDIVVYEDEDRRIAGCCGLHILWEDWEVDFVKRNGVKKSDRKSFFIFKPGFD